MFQEIIKKLYKSTTLKEEIITKGSEIFNRILNFQNLTTGDDAIQMAIEEFSSEFGRDQELIKLFKRTLQKELSGLEGTRVLRSKIKVLKRAWEIESRAILQAPKKSKIITLRLTEEEYNYLINQARKKGTTLSEYIRNRLGLIDT